MTKKQKNSDDALLAFAERFNRLLDETGLAPTGRGRPVFLSKIMKITPGGVRKWLEAESEPSPTNQRKLISWLRSQGMSLNLNWLVTGEGEMFVEKQKEVKYQEINPELLEDALKTIGAELKRAGKTLSDNKTIQFGTVVYNDAFAKTKEGESPKVDIQFVRQMVRLMAE